MCHPTWQLMRFVRNTLAALAFILILSGILPVGFWLGRPLIESQRVQKADAIVVLGGGVIDRDTLSRETAYRLLHGVRLFKRGYAPVIILTGGNPLNAIVPESDVMARIAVELGVPASALIVEHRAARTRTQSLAVAELATQRHVRSVLLVTSALHTRRAQKAFQKAGLDVICTPPTTAHGMPSISIRPDRIASRICDLAPVLYEYGAIGLYWSRGWI